mgnify:CR=1 FL=1
MKPINPPQSLMELTAERIREAIIRGELPLGSKLSEQLLADRLDVSRSPVREALALLQIEGLVRVLPKRGTFVFTPDQKVVEDLCDHRAVLEAACLMMALERNPKPLLGGMRQGFEEMKQAIAANDSAAYASGDMRFHRSIVEFSDNQSIARTYRSTIGPLMALRSHLFTALQAQVERSMAEHAALLEACEARDIQGAREIVAEHIGHLAEHYRDTRMESPVTKLRRVR